MDEQVCADLLRLDPKTWAAMEKCDPAYIEAGKKWLAEVKRFQTWQSCEETRKAGEWVYQGWQQGSVWKEVVLLHCRVPLAEGKPEVMRMPFPPISQRRVNYYTIRLI